MLRPLATHPSPDEARAALRRELLDPVYRDDDPLAAVLRWARDLLERALEAAGAASGASSLVAMALLLALVLALLLLASRARRTARVRTRRGVVLDPVREGADTLRAAALDAHAGGRHGEAVLEGFRALARRGVERGRLEDDPGATAREVAAVLGGDGVARAAELFDAVLYGGRPASAEEAAQVLGLDTDVARR